MIWVTYAQAKRDEGSRQTYLDQFLKIQPHPHVRSLRYNLGFQAGLDRIAELEGERLICAQAAADARAEVTRADNYAFLVLARGMLGHGKKQPIIVNPPAFEQLSEEGLETYLIDHEYVHAQDISRGMALSAGMRIDSANEGQFQICALHAILETRALAYQISEGVKKHVGHDTLRRALGEFWKYHCLLSGIEPANELEGTAIGIQLASYRPLLDFIFPEMTRKKRRKN